MTAGEGAEGMVLSGWELDGSTRDVELVTSGAHLRVPSIQAVPPLPLATLF